MTTGIGIPHSPGEQQAYVERLVRAKVTGLMIGENMQAPADIASLQMEAEISGFPLLMTHYSVPFSAVTRAIIDASKQEEHERRGAVTRAYESARIGLRSLGLTGLLKRLAADVQSNLYLFDSRSLEPWQEGLEALPSLTSCQILAAGGHLIDYGLFHHLVAVLGIELERLLVENERSLRLGSELLDDLIQSRLPEQAALDRLEQLNCPAEQSCLASARTTTEPVIDWPQRLRRQGVELLVRSQGNELMVLLANDGSAHQLQAALKCNIGVSNPLITPSRTVEALREARLALAHGTKQRPLVMYNNARDEQSWLPTNLEDARRIHRRVLGTLTDYDAQQGGQLQHTLLVFLQQNRSWQKAADRLNVHKQTLVYRIRRVEEISGRSLDSTEDVAVLWIALQAGQIAGIME